MRSRLYERSRAHLVPQLARAIKHPYQHGWRNMENSHDEIYSGRKPPHDLQLEQALLGAILLSPHTLDRVSDLIDAGHRALRRQQARVAGRGVLARNECGAIRYADCWRESRDTIR
jgi:hypothetical protein